MKGPNLLSSMMMPPTPTPDETFNAALRYAVSVCGHWCKDRVVYLPILDPQTSKISNHIVSIWQKRGYSKDAEDTFVGYEFDELPFSEWADMYQSSTRAAELLKERISTNLILDFPLPMTVRGLAGVILDRRITEPQIPAKKPSLLHRDTLLAGIAKRVSETFDYTVGASKGTYRLAETVPIRGCTIAAAGLHGFGIPISPLRADSIARNRNLDIDKLEQSGSLNAGIREVANALAVYAYPERFADTSLFEIELKRAQEYFRG